MLAAGGKSPKIPISASPHPDAEDEIMATMSTIEPSSRKDQRRLKAACLKRDGYRCAVSNTIDKTSKLDSRLKIPGSAGERVRQTECAHILPFGLRNFDEQNSQEVKQLCYSITSETEANPNRTCTRLKIKPPSGGLSIDISQP